MNEYGCVSKNFIYKKMLEDETQIWPIVLEPVLESLPILSPSVNQCVVIRPLCFHPRVVSFEKQTFV